MFLKQCARQFGTNRENFCVSDVCVHKLSKDKKKKIKDTFDPFVRLSLRNDSYIIIHYQGSSSIVLIQSVYV